jgi:hypothetical protein
MVFVTAIGREASSSCVLLVEFGGIGCDVLQGIRSAGGHGVFIVFVKNHLVVTQPRARLAKCQHRLVMY